MVFGGGLMPAAHDVTNHTVNDLSITQRRMGDVGLESLCGYRAARRVFEHFVIGGEPMLRIIRTD